MFASVRNIIDNLVQYGGDHIEQGSLKSRKTEKVCVGCVKSENVDFVLCFALQLLLSTTTFVVSLYMNHIANSNNSIVSLLESSNGSSCGAVDNEGNTSISRVRLWQFKVDLRYAIYAAVDTLNNLWQWRLATVTKILETVPSVASVDASTQCRQDDSAPMVYSEDLTAAIQDLHAVIKFALLSLYMLDVDSKESVPDSSSITGMLAALKAIVGLVGGSSGGATSSIDTSAATNTTCNTTADDLGSSSHSSSAMAADLAVLNLVQSTLRPHLTLYGRNSSNSTIDNFSDGECKDQGATAATAAATAATAATGATAASYTGCVGNDLLSFSDMPHLAKTKSAAVKTENKTKSAAGALSAVLAVTSDDIRAALAAGNKKSTSKPPPQQQPPPAVSSDSTNYALNSTINSTIGATPTGMNPWLGRQTAVFERVKSLRTIAGAPTASSEGSVSNGNTTMAHTSLPLVLQYLLTTTKPSARAADGSFDAAPFTGVCEEILPLPNKTKSKTEKPKVENVPLQQLKFFILTVLSLRHEALNCVYPALTTEQTEMRSEVMQFIYWLCSVH